MTTPLCAVDDCTNQPFITYPLPLCRRDALQVSLNITDILHANALKTSQAASFDTDKANLAAHTVWDQTSHPPVVYFLVNGDRVKIGTSTNITARVSTLSLRRNNAQLLLEGGRDLEDALHDRFQADRIGSTEWFVLSQQIRDYIAQLLESNGLLRQPVLPPTDIQGLPATAMPKPAKRRPTAEETILTALRADPDTKYTDRAALLAATGLKEGTFANALGKLESTGKIHRLTEGKTVRVALGRPLNEAA